MSIRSLEGMVRSRDPETSWVAAGSITADMLSELQAWIMIRLREQPRADHELVQLSVDAFRRGELPQVTGQRVRTARKYLELAGLVELSAYYHLTDAGRKAQVWQVTPTVPALDLAS